MCLNAVTATGGTLQLRNTLLVNPNLTAAKVSLTSPTIFAYDDIFFDRTNSSLGIGANTVVDFQNVRLFNSLSANTISANTITISNTIRYPVYTSANLTAITGSAGWTAALTSGKLAYWDVANTRWSYVSDDSAV